jgi:putative transposase
MPRPRRVCEPGVVLHVMNRANRKQRIFHGETDYSLFVEVLAAATQKFAVRLLAFCVMPNHWHLVIWPSAGDDVPAYMHWLTSTHVRQYHRVHGLIGTGHLYQGRYVSVPVQTDRHLLTVLRYVEANAVRGRLVTRAQDWPWSSVAEESDGVRGFISPSPIQRPADWLQYLNGPPDGIERLRRAVAKGRPFGSLRWTQETAERCGLTSTLRDPGRPPRIPRPSSG